MDGHELESRHWTREEEARERKRRLLAEIEAPRNRHERRRLAKLTAKRESR